MVRRAIYWHTSYVTVQTWRGGFSIFWSVGWTLKSPILFNYNSDMKIESSLQYCLSIYNDTIISIFQSYNHLYRVYFNCESIWSTLTHDVDTRITRCTKEPDLSPMQCFVLSLNLLWKSLHMERKIKLQDVCGKMRTTTKPRRTWLLANCVGHEEGAQHSLAHKSKPIKSSRAH